MKTKTLKLKDKYLEMGYTSKSNTNPDFIKDLKRWNKDSAKIISEAIHSGDCKTVLREMKNTRGRNQEIRIVSENHDKIIFNGSGEAVYLWDHKERKVYQLE